MLEEFRRIGKYMFQERLVDSHGGNMSIRQGDKIFITRKGVMLGDLKEGDIVEAEITQKESDDLASSSLAAHRAVYKQSSAQAIIHAHPANAIAISITDNKVVPQDAEGLGLYKAAPIVRVRGGVGSEETVRLLPSFLGRENVIAMLKSHGSFATGKTLEEAYKFTSALENSCRILVAVRSTAGRGPAKGTPSPGRPGRSHGGGGRRDRRDFKSAIPPGIGVMDRSRQRRR